MRKGLTISELLVAMAIIGVIAVLVIPGFLKDYHKKLYTTQLKKTYEMLYTAVEEACSDYNVTAFSQTPYYTANGNTAQVKAFLNKYFKTTRPAKNLSLNIFNSTYRSLTDTDKEESWTKTGLSIYVPKTTLKSGEAIGIACKNQDTEPKHSCDIFVDVNATAGPNIGGRDMFAFKLNADTNEIYDADWTACQPDLASNATGDPGGHGCLSRIIKDNWVMLY